MARNIRWQVSFKSLNGTSCKVNIYDNDWPASTVMPVRGAADPFFYEEDNSDDLLNDVIRYRTGYIRVIEDTYGFLDAIYPTGTFDRYVEMVSGSGNTLTVHFNGYIQVQNFQRPFKPGPRVLELPVISPLGLFDKFNFAPITPPTTTTLGALLDLTLGSGTYTKVVFPVITGAELTKNIFSLVVSPWNDDYHHSMTVAAYSKVMKPETYAFLVEGICKAFGWICHDTPDALVFTSFDHLGQYASYPKGHIGDNNYKQTESITQTEESVTSHYTIADDSANINTLLPDTGIEVDYEGEFGAVEFGFDRTIYSNVITYPGMTADDGEKWSLCNLLPIEGLYEIIGVGGATFDSDGYVSYGEHCVAWDGHVGILSSVMQTYIDGEELFKIRLYTKHRSSGSWAISFKGMTSNDGNGGYVTTIGALKDDENVNYYYIETVKTVNSDYVEVVFKYHYSNTTGSLYPQLPAHALIFIYDIRLEYIENDELYAEYRFAPAESSDALPSTVLHPIISSSVTMPISMYRLNDRMIGDTVLTTKVTEYPYLFQKRLELEGVFRGIAPDLYHARMWGYLGKKWRIIAQEYHPWSDECRLTMQHSPVLDAVTYTITANSSNTSISGYSDVVNSGASFNYTISPDTGYTITSVTITMGGVDITSSAYDSSTHTISIASVTGNVVITVEAAATSPYDAEVEYLQSDGTAYIDLQEQIVSSTDVIEIEFTLTQSGNSARGVFGHRASASSKNFTVIVGSTNNPIIDINNGSYSTYRVDAGTSGYNKLCAIHMERANKVISLDNVQVAASTTSSQSFTTDGNARLFMAGGISAKAKIALTKFKWIRSNDILFDMIPVRKNGVGYLYDRESGTLYGNDAGSGAFTYGNDKTT